MRVAREAVVVLLVGILLGVAHGIVRGFPEPAAASDETGACLPPDADQPTIRWVSQEEARRLFEDPGLSFVDARPRDSFQSGHVSGALHVQLEGDSVPENVIALLRSARIVIAYDDTNGNCASATRLASVLARSGLADVRVLEGGMPDWLANEYPAEAGTCRLCP